MNGIAITFNTAHMQAEEAEYEIARNLKLLSEKEVQTECTLYDTNGNVVGWVTVA